MVELSPAKIKAFRKELERREKEEPIRFWNQGEKRHQKQIEVMKRGERFKGVFGGNRCLSEGTKVRRPDGSVTAIEDLQVGDEVVAYDKATGNSVISKVTQTFANGEKDVFRFSFGRYEYETSLDATSDHKILSETESHKVVKERPLGDLSVRRTAALRPTGSEWGTYESRALLLGLLLGDGHFSRQVQFTCADTILAEEMEQYLDSIEYSYCLRKAYGDIQYYVSSYVNRDRPRNSKGQFTSEAEKSELNKWLDSLGLAGTRSDTKFIPKEVWSWDTHSVGQLVSGLIATDGSVYQSHDGFVKVTFTSKSLTMITQLKELCEFRLGIYGSTITADGRGCYSITFGTFEALSRFDSLKIIGKKKYVLKRLLGNVKRTGSRASRLPFRGKEYLGKLPTYDIQIDHPDHLFVLESGLVVSNSGKSSVGATGAVLEAMGSLAEPFVQEWCEEDQEWWYERYNKDEPQNIWCATVNWDVQRDILQPEFFKWLPDPIRAKSVEANRRKGVVDFIELPNKTMVTFKSYDSGKDAFQGASLDLAWLDEEPDLGVWAEIKQRVMDKRGRVLLTMTPLKGLTWAYSEIYLNESKDKEIYSVHFTWDDNPWLDKGEIGRLEATMSEDELAARKYGEFMAAGGTVMSKASILERKREVDPPHARMTWSDGGRFTLSPDGPVEIYELPEKGRHYVIGADVAEGLPSGDNSVLCVIDSSTGVQVAEYAQQVDSTTFTDQMAWLGRFYNTALLAPERNNNGHAVLQRLDRELMYPAVYKHKEDGRLGWPQTVKTRPVVIAYLQDFAREMPEAFNSIHLLNEGLTFVRNARGRPEAAGKGRAGGNKDDRLFAFGIAQAVRDMYGPPLEPINPQHSSQDKKTKAKDPWIERDGDEDAQDGPFVNFDPDAFVNFPMFGEEDEAW